ncbi:PTS fructose transporter subunit IIA, partial [Fusobacterium mortiferum]|nr:PTS fructose transporter subunit IIA [Fusobacterium mortiferum]
MYGVIVATHGNYASGLKSTLKLVCGDMENLRTVDYVAGMTVFELEEQYDKVMEELK